MTSFSVGCNAGSALFGGTAVFVAQYVTSATGDRRSVSYFLILAALISLVAIGSVKQFAKPGEAADQ